MVIYLSYRIDRQYLCIHSHIFILVSILATANNNLQKHLLCTKINIQTNNIWKRMRWYQYQCWWNSISNMRFVLRLFFFFFIYLSFETVAKLKILIFWCQIFAVYRVLFLFAIFGFLFTHSYIFFGSLLPWNCVLLNCFNALTFCVLKIGFYLFNYLQLFLQKNCH